MSIGPEWLPSALEAKMQLKGAELLVGGNRRRHPGDVLDDVSSVYSCKTTASHILHVLTSSKRVQVLD